MIAVCVLPRLAATAAGVASAERAMAVVAKTLPSSATAPTTTTPYARLLDASDGARARGVRPGQRVRDAQAHAPDLAVTAVDVEVLGREVEGLAELLYRHAPACEPFAAIERTCLPTFGVVLDVAGVPRSSTRLLSELARTATQAGHRPVIALSSSRALSLAVAKDMAAHPTRWGRSLYHVDDRDPQTRAALRSRLQLASLELDVELVDHLRATGLVTAQDLVPLLKVGLVERLGAQAARVLPLLSDESARDDVVTPWRPPEQVTALRDFDDDVMGVQPLLFVLRPLVQDVLRRLEARRLRLRELAISLRRRRTQTLEMSVAFPAPTLDVEVVLRVVQARLERAFAQERAGHEGIRGLDLSATHTTPVQPQQLDTVHHTNVTTTTTTTTTTTEDMVPGLVAELVAELGEGRVGYLRPTRAPLPEHMTRLIRPWTTTDVGVKNEDDEEIRQPGSFRRRPRPVLTDPRTAQGRFAVGWSWPLSILATPQRLGPRDAILHERLFCRLDGTDGYGPYEREYRVVFLDDGRRALCLWDTETNERWLCGWFD